MSGPSSPLRGALLDVGESNWGDRSAEQARLVAGLEAHVHTDSAFTHRPMDLTGEEKALVHAAIAGAMTSI